MNSIFAKWINFEEQWFENSYLLFKDGKVVGVDSKAGESNVLALYPNSILHPGLVDTHIHGLSGFDVMDNSVEGLQKISEDLLACGVTSFLPTTLTADTQTLTQVAKTTAEAKNQVHGAKIRGIFFEGPWFTPRNAGAQNPTYMGPPNLEIFEEWQEAANGEIIKIAIAPEHETAVDFTEELTKQGVNVALGHSAATFEQGNDGLKAGANTFIHTFNGMNLLHHRKPGLVGLTMNTNSTYAELIADGHHVHPQAAEILYKLKGSDYLVLISDAMRATGLPEGESTLGEFKVTVHDGTARLSSGNLAGSILKLIDGAKHFVNWGICDFKEALKMASFTPAKSAGIDHLCGRLAPDMDADFIIVDEHLNLEATYINGEKRYTS